MTVNIKEEVHVNFAANPPDERIFSEPTLSSYESDSSIENLGIKPLHSNFLGYRSRPSTALAKKERPNLSISTEITRKQLKVTRTISKDVESDGLSWIQNAFSCKTCKNYVEKEGKCCCGRRKEDHEELSDDTTAVWNANKHCSHVPTNAFGKFQHFAKSPHCARFIRLSDESDCSNMFELLKNVWHLQMPGIMLSVIGSDDTAIPHRLHQIIQRDIAKVGKITHAWVISNGVKRGVSKILGSMLSSHGFPVPAIAFCSWGGLDNTESLEVEDLNPNQLIYYNFDGRDEKRTLDPNHTHFFLVDSGTKYFSNSHEKLRKEFEYFMSCNINVPLLYILIGGSEEDGQSICKLLNEENHVIVIKGTGGFTDNYCDFQKHIEIRDESTCTCLEVYRYSYSL